MVKEAPREISIEYRELAPQSFGNVAASHQAKTYPKAHQPKRDGERCRYGGAGVVAVTIVPDAGPFILVWRHENDLRFRDFGGDKADAKEFSSVCAARHFAEQTDGIFCMDADWTGKFIEDIVAYKEESPYFKNLQDFVTPQSRNHLVDLCKDWAREQLEVKTFNSQHNYGIHVIHIPFIIPDVLQEMAENVDHVLGRTDEALGPRVFEWLTPNQFVNEALHPRLTDNSFLKWVETPAFVEEVEKLRDGVVGDISGLSSFKAE